MDSIEIKEAVKQYYKGVAEQPADGCCSSSCCESGAQNIPLVEYGELNTGVIEAANLGLGCGIPTLAASLKPGETVLDLGSGAGIDVFLAAKAVGEDGYVIGVDMTPAMISRAAKNAEVGGYSNVEFRLGEIENLPIEDESIDIVLSNCVINLVPDKRKAFAEIYRVLKSGGRFAISDIVSFGSVPDQVRCDLELWSCCIGGAVDENDYLHLIKENNFVDVEITHSTRYPGPHGEDYGFLSITLRGRKA